MGMFHMIGVTPEAQTVEDALGDQEPKDTITVTDEDIEDLYASYDTKDGSANLVVFSGPQLSLYELKTLSELLEGKKVGEGTSLIVTTNGGNKYAGEKLEYLRKIEEAGGTVLEAVCFYILDSITRLRAENGWDNLVTNSAKLANIIAAHRFSPILRRTEECVEAALTGKVERP
jgi:predicted aconitase